MREWESEMREMVIKQYLVLDALVLVVTVSWSDHHLVAQAPLALPSCSEKCGNISLPFPFGMKPDCFWSKMYELECKETPSESTTQKLTFKELPIEVINISATDSTITIAYTFSLALPFGTMNHFYNIMMFPNVLPSTRSGHVSSVSITLNWLVMESKNPKDWLLNPYFTSLTNLTYTNSSTRVCDSPYSDDYITAYKCRCNSGYRGNPYLEDGCKDIDECDEEDIKRSCPNCRNLPGDYDCGPPATNWIGKHIIVGIGSALGALISILFTWRLHKIIKKRRKTKLKQKYFKRNGGLLLQQHLSSLDGNIQKSKLFDSKELEKATDNFNDDRVLGQGGQGTVYKGMLTDGRIVAVKKSKLINEGNIENFINEVFILSIINHRNVVKLLGCCLETEVPLLVYEYIPNGTLYHYIHNLNEEFQLTWEVRLRIVAEVAGALSYLHTAASIPIYHRDIKSTNILLDDKYRAKVADFGTSKSVALDQTHLTTQVRGTFGYLDPEYFRSGKFTNKSDVYSFGIILVELLTGKRPISLSESNEEIMYRGLAPYFIECIKEDQLFNIVDRHILSQEGKEEIIAFADLARKCLCLNGKKRPTMKEVALKLETIRNLSQQHSIHRENEDRKDHKCLEIGEFENLDVAIIKSFPS